MKYGERPKNVGRSSVLLADGAVAARSSERTTRHIPFQGSLLKANRLHGCDKEAIPRTPERLKGECRLWLRIDKAQREHNESAYPLIADMRADIAEGSEVPLTDIEVIREEEAARLGGLELDRPFDPVILQPQR